ncbi:AAA family ATPase [Candidatus Saccharibacteria bacterium]|nr:AAA family ATPase [Candidatus Saccharibacteria bacterium]
MKIRSLAVNQFKKFTSPTRLGGVEDGLNVVVGPNEMGKSTLLDALRAVLFEKYSSRAQPIMALQNDRNQAAPVVELAIELDDGLYRITKRFVKKPYARLACPDGRNLEGDTAEDTLRALLDFHEPGKTGAKPETLGMWNVLWVQQGQSFGALELPESARSSLHSALESEVGAVLGGRRGRALPKAIESQLGELVTSTTNRPRGAYKELIDRVNTLRQELGALRVRRQDLTQTLADLEEAQENLQRLSIGDRDRADRKELDEARERHSQLAELEARIEAGCTERELRSRTLQQAEQAVEARIRLKADVKTEMEALEAAGSKLTGVREEEEVARSKVDGLRGGVRQAETSLTKADEAVSQHRRVLSAAERQARVSDLEARFEKAQAAEDLQGKAQQAAAAILVTDEAIEGIREAAQRRDSIRSRLDAAATVISFDMSEGCISGIDVNEEPLMADGRTVRSVEPVTITIPGRGRILVEPAIKDRDRLLRQQRDAATALREALEEAGAKSVSAAEDQYSRRLSLLRDAELSRQGAELHAPATIDYEAGAKALADYIEGLRRVLQREMEELDLQALPTRRDAETALRTAQEQADEARSVLDTARAALSGPEDTLGQLQTEIATLQGRYDESKDRLERLHVEVTQAEADCSDDDLQSNTDSARTALSEQETAIERLEEKRSDETLPQLKARIGRLEKALRERREKRAKLETEVVGLRSRVEAAEGAGLDEAIEQWACELELAKEEKRRHDREVEVLGLLLSTLRSAEQEAKEQYLSPVLKRVRPYLQLLFPGADIRIDENLHVAGVVREAGYEEAFNHLSMGTQEQIAVLVRLAFAEMLVEQGHPATVVLDDALVFSDDRRMGRIFDILNMAARNVQVIVFTCREQLFEGLGGRHLSLAPAGGEELASA